jgi:hypothetical protein
MDIKAKFIFCFNKYKEVRKDESGNYNPIMDLVFTGSKTSSLFIANNVVYKDPETAWLKMKDKGANFEKFIDKAYAVFSTLK